MAQPDDNLEEDEGLASAAPVECLVIRSQSIDQIESAIDRLSDQSTVEQIIHGINITSILLGRAKLLRKTMEQTAVQWIDHHGPIDIGDTRYMTGHQKRVTCIDVIACTNVLLDASHGDIAALCEYFCSNPYKYGSVHKLIGDDLHARLFHVEQRPKLVEGKPQKELIRVDRRYTHIS